MKSDREQVSYYNVQSMFVLNLIEDINNYYNDKTYMQELYNSVTVKLVKGKLKRKLGCYSLSLAYSKLLKFVG